MEIRRVFSLSTLLLLLLLSLCAAPLSLGLSLGEKVKVTVKGVATIGRTDENFVCATVDWWPSSKCNYGQCPWGKTSILNLDLKNPILNNAVKAFDSLRIRLGGSLQDQVLYRVGGHERGSCQEFKNSTEGLFGFTRGCLPMSRWDDLNDFLNRNRVVVTFGLNALYGKSKASRNPDDTLYIGKWDPSNAEEFINYTVSKGYDIESWELGNELCGSGVSARVDPKQYAEDVIVLRSLLNRVYRNSKTRLKLLAPGGFFDQRWFAQFLQASTGPNVVVDSVTHHVYNLGAGVDPDLIRKVQDPYFLDEITQTYRDVEVTINNFAPWSSAWVGESGGAYNSGGKDVSHTFVDGFWYLDQLGMTSTFDHKVFCRQSLIGGNYGLLNTTSFIPNPDYYGALLWHRLMGPGVLSTTHNGSPYLRAYTHCSRKKPGVTLLLINMSNSTSFDVSVQNDMNLYPPDQETTTAAAGAAPQMREEYHLTPKNGDIQSDVLLLNGTPLRLTKSKYIPHLKPNFVEDSSPIYVASHSIVFVDLKGGFKAPACA